MLDAVIILALTAQPDPKPGVITKAKHGIKAVGHLAGVGLHKVYAGTRWFCIKTHPFVNYAGSAAQLAQYLRKP